MQPIFFLYHRERDARRFAEQTKPFAGGKFGKRINDEAAVFLNSFRLLVDVIHLDVKNGMMHKKTQLFFPYQNIFVRINLFTT